MPQTYFWATFGVLNCFGEWDPVAGQADHKTGLSRDRSDWNWEHTCWTGRCAGVLPLHRAGVSGFGTYESLHKEDIEEWGAMSPPETPLLRLVLSVCLSLSLSLSLPPFLPPSLSPSLSLSLYICPRWAEWLQWNQA